MEQAMPALWEKINLKGNQNLLILFFPSKRQTSYETGIQFKWSDTIRRIIKKKETKQKRSINR